MYSHPLVVEKLTKNFESSKFLWIGKQSFTAVDDISFHLKEGEILGLLGPNGAGKTTTIQMLLNILTPTAGSISYFGKELSGNNKQVLQQVAYASSYMRLPSALTVRQSLVMFGMLYNIPYKTLKHRIDEQFLVAFNLAHIIDRKVSFLSAGQTTAVLLARTFLVHPSIVLLDEPTAALDPESAYRIRDFIREQNRQHGVSMLFTSHNMSEVEDLCDRILVLKDGNIIADNTPEHLAASVCVVRVQLRMTGGDSMARAVKFFQEQSLTYTFEGQNVEVKVEEQKIADLLTSLAQKGIVYTQIAIEKPTLEDYFLTLSKEA
jgi:ABC-2 type transport system ATP-binding protein